VLGSTKHAGAETTWRLIREMEALNGTPRSVTEVARAIGLAKDGIRLSGTARQRVRDALTRRPGVLLSQEIRHGQPVTLYRWEAV
jgi:hypothetical protein